MSRRGSILQDYGNIDATQSTQAQRDAASYYQRDKEQANQMKMHQADQKKKDAGDATDFIGGLSVPHVGDNTVDLFNDSQIQKLQGELNGMQANGATVQDIKIKAMQELPKISQGYTLAKNGYDKIKSGLQDLTKDYPSGNMEAARNLAAKDLLKDIAQFDDKGNMIGYKDPSLIPQDKNYLQAIESPDKLSQWYTPSGSLEKHIQTLPHTNLGESTKIRDKKGVERDNIWTGTGTVFSDIKRDENGKAIGMDIKSETVPLGVDNNGNPVTVNVLPKDEFNTMLGNKEAAADFSIKFNKHLKDMNINPADLDPRAVDYLQRQYARDWLKETGIEGSSFIPKVSEKQPLPPRVTVNNRYGNGSDTNINDVYKGIQEATNNKENNMYFPDGNIGTRMNSLNADAQKVIFDYIGDKDLNEKNTFLVNNDGKIQIYRVSNIKDENNKPTPIVDNKYLITTLPKVATNLKVQPNAKSKAAVVAQGEGSKFNIIDPNTGKVVLSGVDKAAADKAKSKGYKIQ